MVKLDTINMLIAGQLKTSRTETLENYYRAKVNSLGIVGISNPFAVKGLARCTLYEKGKTAKEFPIISIQLRGIYWINQLLMAPVFFLYALAMFRTVLKLKRKFDVFIGVACFSTLFGIFLKKLGIVRNVVYYTLDYYPMPVKFHVNTIINKTIWYLDRYCCRKASLVLNISPRIPEARKKLMHFSSDKYRHVLAPLTYGEDLLRFRPMKEIERDTLVFVGTISLNQGLQLVVEAFPDILKLKPELKVRVIGKGAFGNEIKRMVDDNGLSDKFIFHGFVEKEEDVFDIVSRCAIGICPWTNDADNNAIYADPGKPKLYAFCGIPMIITRVTAVADEIDISGAGIAIDYDKKQFIDAVTKILKDDINLEEYRKKSYAFAQRYTTEAVFKSVSQEILNSMGNNRRD